MSDEEYIQAVKTIIESPKNEKTVREAFRLNNMKFRQEHAHWCSSCRVRVYNNLTNYVNEKSNNNPTLVNGL